MSWVRGLSTPVVSMTASSAPPRPDPVQPTESSGAGVVGVAAGELDRVTAGWLADGVALLATAAPAPVSSMAAATAMDERRFQLMVAPRSMV